VDDTHSPNNQKPYTVWMHIPMEGWHPTDCDDLQQCFSEMLAVGHSGDYRITCPVAVEFVARPGGA
jgi:hypothetical protein